MGIVGLGLSTLTVDGLNGAVFQMFAHGIMTALLFSSVGYVYDRTDTKMIPELGGMSKIMPVASEYFIFGAFAGMGVPGFANFWAELIVFLSSLKVYPVRGALAISALVVSALFMLRVVQKTFYGEKNERFAGLPDVSFWLGLPRMILVGVIVLFGLFPVLILDTVQTAAVAFGRDWCHELDPFLPELYLFPDGCLLRDIHVGKASFQNGFSGSPSFSQV